MPRMRQRGFGWIEVIVCLAIVGVIVAGVAGIYHVGKGAGADEQKATDQIQFDAIEAQRTKQKAEAAALYQKAQADIIALQAERDDLKTKLERQREELRKATDDLRAKYAGLGLRFQSKGAGDRGDGGCTQSAPANPASNSGPAYCELSGEAAAALRAIAYDADTLRDDYKILYDWAHEAR